MNANATILQTAAPSATTARPAAVIAILFGLGLVFVTGFAHSNVLHNAAHDTRHALSFPCH